MWVTSPMYSWVVIPLVCEVEVMTGATLVLPGDLSGVLSNTVPSGVWLGGLAVAVVLCCAAGFVKVTNEFGLVNLPRS
jgi:uncharacterized membrane protein YjfL (UPF0719 family)